MTLDCAYTYFYDAEQGKIEAGVTDGLKDIAAFVIVDFGKNNAPISGYGYYSVYADTAETLMFNARILETDKQS